MRIHILGICGTFMGGVAQLASRDGHTVTGSDQQAYPPMSTQLQAEGIQLIEGYDPAQLDAGVDLVIIGNALSRGNPVVEEVLNRGIPFTSGPRWLGEQYLRGKHTIAVAGTHGKTTTSSMVAWILEKAGFEPGFLIGGVPLNFGYSARTGKEFFVVEADEYDTAFFDKRSKFVHYRPRVAILNNLEYDHADIFPDIEAIQTQFHHLVRTIPGNGTIVANGGDPKLEGVLERGCWSGLKTFSMAEGSDWQVRLVKPDGTQLEFSQGGTPVGAIEWNHSGQHNALNACAALVAAISAGVDPQIGLRALEEFKGVKRRLEEVVFAQGITVYDDFAHHPTAIRLTLEGLRRKVSNARILVALEPRSNTMRAGVHADELGPALIPGDYVWLKTTDGIDWDPQVALAALDGRGRVVTKSEDLLSQMLERVKPGDHVVFMSNGSFDACPARFAEAVESRAQD